MFWNVTLTLLSGLGTTIQIFFLTLLFCPALGAGDCLRLHEPADPPALAVQHLGLDCPGNPPDAPAHRFHVHPWDFGQQHLGRGAGRMTATVVAFSINYACYFSVIYRGGIQGVPAGQREAAEVLGTDQAADLL